MTPLAMPAAVSTTAATLPGCGLPARVGIGLKPEHFLDVLETLPALGFFEVHAENYMVAGGPMHHYLQRIRERYALSMHGVGLSIGADTPPDAAHLQRLAVLLERYAPESFSEHLAWSSHGGEYLNDLLPLPYNAATLQRVCEHVDIIQSRLQRRLLLENPATYVEFSASTFSEAEFMHAVVQRTGCGLLLDVNNLYVSSINHGRDPQAALRALVHEAVGQIHLAGHARSVDSAGATLLIDSHGAAVDDAVWALYELALTCLGPVPTLIERDNDVPPLPVLVAEAAQAERLLQACQSRATVRPARHRSGLAESSQHLS